MSNRQRIINQGTEWQPHWVIFDRSLRNVLFESKDFNACVLQLDAIEEKEQRQYECSNGSCDD